MAGGKMMVIDTMAFLLHANRRIGIGDCDAVVSFAGSHDH